MRFGKNAGHIAVVTGASSGIGKAMARGLARRGCFVILSGRNSAALERLSEELGRDRSIVITADLATTEGCVSLFEQAKAYSPDILINNAGFGIYGRFAETDAEREAALIDLNVRAMQLLFKLFLEEFEKNRRGYILNVGSIAGFMPGPLMSSYYASKAFVVRQTQGVWLEQLVNGSPVKVSVLCPGPVDTNFNSTAGITGFFRGISAEECADAAIKGMEYELPVIIPSVTAKLIVLGASLTPALVAGVFAYAAQKGKKRIEDKD